MLVSGVKNVRLDEKAISLSLEYFYKKATSEVLHFNDKKTVDKVGMMVEGILYCKARLTDDQSIRIVGGLEDIIDLETFTGINFKVPIVDKFSPLAVSIANHLHQNVTKHKGVETTYRMSLEYVRILGGRSLFKMLRDECAFCQKQLLKHMKQIMGPLSNQQLSISPVFFYTMIDAWGPLKAYTPPYERATRRGDKTHDVYMLVFACIATGMINCQVMEGGKNTACVLDCFNRFFNEAVVPRICYIDKDSAIIKVLTEGQLEIVSNDGIISKQRGIQFETCSAQGHSQHGRIEARIKMIQEAFTRSDLRSFKLHSLGWQTFAKTVEHEINSIPLGFLQHQGDAAPLLRILTPNFLKLNAAANRSPRDLFTIPHSGPDLMSRLQEAYKLFFQIWNNDYVPLIANRQKWHAGDENLVPEDIVYFKLRDSIVGSRWCIGKVEDVILSKDGKVRRIIVGYKFDSEQGDRVFRTVERPVREVIKLFNVEDTSLFEEIAEVRSACEQILSSSVVWYHASNSSLLELPHTYACNSSLSFCSHGYCATDIGFLVQAQFEDGCQAECAVIDDSLWGETEIGMDSEDNDTFFMINNNDTCNDKFDKICLF